MIFFLRKSPISIFNPFRLAAACIYIYGNPESYFARIFILPIRGENRPKRCLVGSLGSRNLARFAYFWPFSQGNESCGSSVGSLLHLPSELEGLGGVRGSAGSKFIPPFLFFFEHGSNQDTPVPPAWPPLCLVCLPAVSRRATVG